MQANPGKISKFISTIATTTISISILSFFSVSPAMAVSVHVIRHCETYNNAGDPVGPLKEGYYPLVRYMKFRNSGLNGATIIADFSSSGRGVGNVNIALRCLEYSEGQVIEYNQ